ncbi:MAG: WYL domain-containing protein [Methylovulum sp.]|jgi:predicted DNA-binding transcriptional regulator YafY|nr:WYL domain-containing protein [Methylovulum sp.]MCF7999893.1 WYL domain-containing protein [Methylovulum sp.]
MAKPKEHDKTAVRLTQILRKLNQGEKLDPRQLADEFQVTLRTIQRDLLERFSYLPFQKDNNLFYLEAYYLGKLNTQDVERFACLTGIKDLFPTLKNEFLRELFDSRISQAYLVKGHHYEDLSRKSHEFKQLEQAILQHRWIQFMYKEKSYRSQPYKLVNHKAIWYLAAVTDEQLKAFSFSQLQRVVIECEIFTPDTKIHNTIANEDSIWFSENKREIVLKVDSSVAYYFQRRDLLPNQQIDKTLEDGSLIVSSRIAHDHQILPLIRYWLPNIEVISPNEMRLNLLQGLREYLGKVDIGQ